MANRCSKAPREELSQWAAHAAEQLALTPLQSHDVDKILSAAANISTGFVRSAGPVAMYFAGLLVATGQAANVHTACRLVARLMELPDLPIEPNNVQHTPQGIAD